MKIISSFIEELTLTKGKYHSICFLSSRIQQQFRQLLKDSLTNKNMSETTFLQLVDKQGNKLTNRQIYFIDFDCNLLSLVKDKDTIKHLHDLLFYYLENQPELIDEYIIFNEYLYRFISTIELKSNDLIVEFTPTAKTIQNMIKSLDIHIEYKEDEFIPNYIMRDYLIKTLLMMNMLEKEVLLLITYPESDVGFNDYSEVIKLIKSHNVTTLVISAQKEFITSANIDRMLLIEEYGTIYNVSELIQEMDVFNLLDRNDSLEHAKNIAMHDFLNDYELLDEEIKQFLESNSI